ncbi:AbrB/MazE/SpoVT family DNA-binding domain-containing protein [Brevundimonas sp. 2R-24]|uniref:AbrB/MazE/SpoVT family DNA-binding domain-containing protein n=1 Tax=Peiella sedimenti TaxID=3061083 RepID=A0ABT8SIN2_9CAUL|nr:AbrB/MazE/SpoVT family DNA-binding domain-containing protein [Caulobacteraceae bacterium XZ-24]
MIALKIIQVGNSAGVVLPKEALIELGVKKGDTLYLTKAPDGSMRVAPHDERVARQIEAFEEVGRQYRDTLRILAK